MEHTPHTPAVIDFHGNSLMTADINGTVYVALKPIAEGMGLAWTGQHKKITDSENYQHMLMVMETGQGPREMLCIPMAKLNG